MPTPAETSQARVPTCAFDCAGAGEIESAVVVSPAAKEAAIAEATVRIVIFEALIVPARLAPIRRLANQIQAATLIIDPCQNGNAKRKRFCCRACGGIPCLSQRSAAARPPRLSRSRNSQSRFAALSSARPSNCSSAEMRPMRKRSSFSVEEQFEGLAEESAANLDWEFLERLNR